MATVTAPPPVGNRPAESSTPPPIWPIPIEVFGATGEYASGKTLGGLTIDPLHTLCYDFEGSATPYVAGLGFKHVDSARELIAKYPKGYRPKDVWEWWLAHVRKEALPGKYTVIHVDPISELENGLVEWVRDNCTQFGLTKNQIEKFSGLFWGAVKDYWKQILNDLRVRCQTFYFTAHMRDEYKGGSRTGKREAKGKETLFELASLYLEYERLPDKKGNVPAVPSATVLKHRLVVFHGGKIIPAVPPRLPEATPDAIRHYLANPPDYDKLKASERVVEHELTEEEKLRLQAEIASKQAEASQAELSKLELIRQAAEQQRAQAQQPGPAPSSDQSHVAAQHKREQAVARAEEELREHESRVASEANQPISESAVNAILELLEDAFKDPDEFRNVLKAIGEDRNPPAEVTVPRQLTKAEGSELLQWMANRINQRQGEVAQANGQAKGESEEPPFETNQTPVAGDGVDADWHAELTRLLGRSGWSLEGPGSQGEYLKQFGFSSWRSVSREQAVPVIQHLKERELGAREENDYPK